MDSSLPFSSSGGILFFTFKKRFVSHRYKEKQSDLLVGLRSSETLLLPKTMFVAQGLADTIFSGAVEKFNRGSQMTVVKHLKTIKTLCSHERLSALHGQAQANLMVRPRSLLPPVPVRDRI